jgi:hypothetical protein
MPEPDALQIPQGEQTPAQVTLTGVSDLGLAPFEKVLSALGLSVACLAGTLEEGEVREKAPVVLVTSDPLRAVGDLAVCQKMAPIHALAFWERYHHQALARLRGRPVFVTNRAVALADVGGFCEGLGRFLSAHGCPPEHLASPQQVHVALEVGEANGSSIKDEGLLLSTQEQLSSVLDQLAGPHDRFEPAPLEPESPCWMGAET